MRLHSKTRASTPMVRFSGLTGNRKSPWVLFMVGINVTAHRSGSVFCRSGRISGSGGSSCSRFGVNTTTWDDALTAAGTLKSDMCGLTDGSLVGDWSLPTKSELHGVSNGTEPFRYTTPGPFTNPQAYYYSSTTDEAANGLVYRLTSSDGTLGTSTKDETFYTWPVRRVSR